MGSELVKKKSESSAEVRDRKFVPLFSFINHEFVNFDRSQLRPSLKLPPFRADNLLKARRTFKNDQSRYHPSPSRSPSRRCHSRQSSGRSFECETGASGPGNERRSNPTDQQCRPGSFQREYRDSCSDGQRSLKRRPSSSAVARQRGRRRKSLGETKFRVGNLGPAGRDRPATQLATFFIARPCYIQPLTYVLTCPSSRGDG
jgi:hypothetical protein